jgi:predicted MFS family arabinose efflux permease
MGLAAFLSTRFIVPLPQVEAARQPLLAGVFGGLGDFFRTRLTRRAAIAMILVCSGYIVLTNITLYTEEATGELAEKYVGLQLALRFGFKIVGGLILGWLLTRTYPRMGMLVTGAFCLASVVWVLSVPGKWFLLSFGLMGVGELFGVYYPNYILSCSPKSKMRRNMSFNSMLNMPSALVAVFYGFLADHVGMRASFLTSIVLLVATLLLVQLGLPARPRPQETDLEDSDLALASAGLVANIPTKT